MSGTLAGIIDDSTESEVSFFGDISTIYTKEYWYLRINSVDIEQTGKELSSLILWDLLLHRYTDTWLRLDSEQMKYLQVFSPLISTTLLEKNAKKVRLLPTADES